MGVCVRVRVCVCMCVFVSACVFVCLYIYVHVLACSLAGPCLLATLSKRVWPVVLYKCK